MKNKNQTRLLTKKEAADDRKWFILDATGKTLGRFASHVAKILRGKHKVTFTPHVDCGDGVVIINASKIKVTGAKEAQKIYRYHTQHPGGLREIPYRVMKARKPDYILRNAIAGMLPQSRLARQQLKKLRIFADDKHDLNAQNPICIE